jgi:predicted NAD/FAD-binding protein
MSRPTLAIVGTGIAGLGCAHFLHRRYALTLFERGDHVGGHTHTIEVAEPAGPVPFDTGFMVFNRVTYPYLVQLFEELGVPVRRTDMSFSVQHVPSGLEFSGSGWNHLFAQRRNLLRPRFWRMLAAIGRFNAEAVRALDDPRWADMTLGDYVRTRGYGRDFLELYLVPMSGAVWSTPPDLMLEFPAMTLVRFFHNHGFLGLHTQHPWWTVSGGAREYVRRLIPPFADRIRRGVAAVSVHREGEGAVVASSDGRSERFDKVILAAHADESLRLLSDADDEERRLLGEFRYQPNLAVVHTDASVMPHARLAWSSWNYRMARRPDGEVRPQTVYWMNRLQSLATHTDYFVSINGEHEIDPTRIHRRIPYEHPLFSLGAVRAQAGLRALNRRSPSRAVYFAGSYFRYGFHEDAFGSAVDLARLLSDAPVYPGVGWLPD